MSYNNVDPATHCITGMVDWECVSLKPLWAVPCVLELLEGTEVLQIPDPAPPVVRGTKELEKELGVTFEQILLRRIFYDEMIQVRSPVTRTFVRE
jgi:hypothetical protein